MRGFRRSSAWVVTLFVLVPGVCPVFHAAAWQEGAEARQGAARDLGRYVGEYDLMGQTIKVAVRAGSVLTVTVPGQPTYDLTPVEGSPDRFDLVIPGGVEGFALEFTMKEGVAAEAVFHQPNGIFPAKRKQPAATGAAPQTNAQFVEGFVPFVERVVEEWRVPGVAVAVVRDGEVVMARGFGERDVEKNLPVTEHTRFAIGSATKAFTSTVLAMLVDEGKLDWDKPVREAWPAFRLSDDYATAHLSVRDLVTHRSGWPRHDLAWYGATGDRAEMMRRLRYLEPTAGIREKFQYNNFMVVAAGRVAEELTGRTWEELVRERIFGPLGMKESTFSVSDMASGDCAIGYVKEEDRIEATPYRNIDAMGPAGSINSSAADMARWVLLHLSDGAVGGARLVSAGQMQQLHAPVVVVPADGGGIPRPDEIVNTCYSPGWFVSSYRGRLLVEHGGNIDGFSALVAMLPRDNVGIVVLANRGGVLATSAIAYTAFDRLLGLGEIDWDGKAKAVQGTVERIVEAVADAGGTGRVAGTSPSHPLAEYAGTFSNPGYGDMVLTLEGETLSVAINGVSSALEHWHYDVFSATDKAASGTKVSFLMNTRGDIDRVSLTGDPGSPEVVFTRRADPALARRETLARYVGQYDLSGVAVAVALRGDTLTVTVPGQPTYDLVPVREHLFDLIIPGGIKGFSLRFTMEGGEATEAAFVQPNGTFVARRKK